ncbi:hypothetical protein ES703_50868 [subsurface metagenome]
MKRDFSTAFVEFVRQDVTSVVVAGGACSAGVFPLGLGWQAVGQDLLVGQPSAESLRIVPVDIDNGFAVSLGETFLAAQFSVLGVEQLVLKVRYLIDTHIKRLGNLDGMGWLFVEVPFAEQVKLTSAAKDGQYFRGQRSLELAHLKRAGLNPNKLHTN